MWCTFKVTAWRGELRETDITVITKIVDKSLYDKEVNVSTSNPELQRLYTYKPRCAGESSGFSRYDGIVQRFPTWGTRTLRDTKQNI